MTSLPAPIGVPGVARPRAAQKRKPHRPLLDRAEQRECFFGGAIDVETRVQRAASRNGVRIAHNSHAQTFCSLYAVPARRSIHKSVNDYAPNRTAAERRRKCDERLDADRQRVFVDSKCGTVAGMNRARMLAAHAETNLQARNALREIREIFAAHRRHHAFDVHRRAFAHVRAQSFRRAPTSLTTGGYPRTMRNSALHAVRARRRRSTMRRDARLKSVANCRIERAQRSRSFQRRRR